MPNRIPDLNHGDAMDTTRNDGGPAMPVSDPMGRDIGLTKRDWFAGMALPGIISETYINLASTSDADRDMIESVARHAYELADAMLKARDA